MAQLVLTAVGSAIGGQLGAFIGSNIGARLDASLRPAREGPRIEGVKVSSTAEGAGVACVFGRARVAGQMIWAARFKEARTVRRTGGGKGGPKVADYSYSLSFAMAVGEGPIDGVGRVWADGKPLDLTGVTMRVYRGTDDQTPDALIAAVEGSAPAYRGTAYVVFEDMALAPFGNRAPQLSFEVFRRPRPVGADLRLEDRLTGVCLIPGAGEFVYGTQTILRRQSLVKIVGENTNNTQGRPDLMVSLDQLQAQLPNVDTVMLVVSWFGTDVRLGHCQIRPGVERLDRVTTPITWRAGGVGRLGARLLSTVDGGPAFGGTPADATVVQAITELKARGYKVGLYPFILMDCEGYPWRGRIAPEADGTSAVATDVSHFFGAADPSDFSVSSGSINYGGPAEWGLRRMVLHYAKLATLAGGVDTFLIGSELRGVTTARSAASTYPAVSALQGLASDARAILGGSTAISYAADWSEYFGHQPADGSGDVHFHLDPLWADPNIDFVGVDWYPPLADWRDGEGHLDADAGFKGTHDPAYLAASMTGGEGFDFYYASDAARTAQTRSPITDGAYGEPWVFRPKDLKSWWSNAHHDRPGGVRSVSATPWVPESKPIRLIEFGCSATDKGANAPNLFLDAKSSESSLPAFSNGTRDDEGQRLALEAVLTHFASPSNNPVSSLYDGPMVAGMNAWCWDARPFPDFPARTSLWADAENWPLGHWLNGRSGLGPLADLVRAVGERGGVEITAKGLAGAASGYVIDRPMRVRDALAPLAEVFGFDAAERDGGVAMVARAGAVTAALTADDLALPEEGSGISASRRLPEAPDTVRVRFIDGGADYQTGAASLRRDPATGGGSADIDLPVVLTRAEAETAGRRMLAEGQAAKDEVTVHVAPLAALRAEPGDVVTVDGLDGSWRVVRAEVDEDPRLTLAPVVAVETPVLTPQDWDIPAPLDPPGPPVLLLLDLPPVAGLDDARPLVAAACEPWRPLDVTAGGSDDGLTLRARVDQPATVGELLADLPAGPLWRIDETTVLDVSMEGEALQSRFLTQVLAGANGLAVLNAEGDWEVLQFLDAVATGEGTYQLSRLLRGQGGTELAMGAPTGSPLVLLTPDLVRADVSDAERGLPLLWRAAPAGGPSGGLAMTEANFTWRGVAQRPWSPVHLAAVQDGGDITISWIRRARLSGDGWEVEPPLSEEVERYRLEIFDGDNVVRTVEVFSPNWTYTAADQTADFGGAAPNPFTIRVAQGSAVYGWGSPATRDLTH